MCFCLFMSHSSCHQCHFFSTVPSFDFMEDCFICGQFCNVTGDPKHPACWEKNPGVLCRTADRGKNKDGRPRKSYKDVLFEVCKKRKSAYLFFFFFRYHKICYLNFVNERNIKYANSQYDRSSPDKEPFNYILWSITNEEERI